MRLEELALRRVKGSLWLETAPPAPAFPRLDRDVTADVARDRRRDRRRDDGAAAARGRRARRADRGRPDRPRRHRPHDRQGLLPARADLRAAAVQARRRRGAALRRGQRGGAGLDRGARRRDGIDCDFRRRAVLRRTSVDALGRRGRGATRRSTPACPRRWSTRRRCRSRSRPPCASTTRPSSTRRSTCWRSPRQLPEVYEHTHAVQVGDVVRTPGGRDHRRAHDRRDPLPVPGPLAGVRPRAPAALLRDRLPDRRRAARRHVHQRRLARRARSAPCRWTARSCCWSAARATAPARAATPRSATRALEAFAREHWDVRSVEYRWSAQDNTTVDGAAVRRPADAVRGPRADGHRLRQVGPDRRHRRRAAARRPRPRPREPVRRRCSTRTGSTLRASARQVREARTRQVGVHFVGDRVTKRGRRDDRGPRARRGRHRPPPRREGRRLPRRGRHAVRGLADLHPPRLPGQLQPRRALAGTAPATARASRPTAPSSRARPSTGSSVKPNL